MAASTNDLFKKTGASTVTTLQAPGKPLAATTITVGSTTNYPTDTGIVIAIRQVDTSGALIAGTYTEWSAIVTSSTTLTIVATPVMGNDQVYPAGSTTQVYIPLSSYNQQKMIDGLLTSLNQDGSLKTIDGTKINSSLGLFSQSVLYTASGTYTKPANLKFVVVEAVGGGGGGGGAGSAAASNSSIGSGGGGGAYSRKKILASALGTSETITIGAAGTGGAAGINAGGAGGDTSLGTLVVAKGGQGGAAGTFGATAPLAFGLTSGGDPATSVGDFTVQGHASQIAWRLAAGAAFGGGGGDSMFGVGAISRGSSGNGNTGNSYGAGGGGGVDNGASTNRSGGAGTAGLVIVSEYY